MNTIIEGKIVKALAPIFGNVVLPKVPADLAGALLENSSPCVMDAMPSMAFTTPSRALMIISNAGAFVNALATASAVADGMIDEEAEVLEPLASFEAHGLEFVPVAGNRRLFDLMVLGFFVADTALVDEWFSRSLRFLEVRQGGEVVALIGVRPYANRFSVSFQDGIEQEGVLKALDACVREQYLAPLYRSVRAVFPQGEEVQRVDLLALADAVHNAVFEAQEEIAALEALEEDFWPDEWAM